VRPALLLCALLAAATWPAGLLSASSTDGSRLMDAVKRGDAAAVRALLRAHVDVNTAEGDGTTALHWAAQADDVALVRTLLEAGARVSTANRLGMTPLMLAATNGSDTVLGLLLEAGANANEASPDGETVLMTTARTGNVAAIARVLKAGADVNATEKWRGETALMWAAAENHGPAVAALVAAGAHVDQQARTLKFPNVRYNLATHATLPPPQGGFSALMFAARQGAGDSVRALADANANLNIQDPDGTTALILAVVNVHQDVAALLLERGADPNLADVTGMTPLYAAVELHTVEMYPERKPLRKSSDKTATIALVKALLAKGATPDAPLKNVTLRWGRRRGAGDGALGAGATPLMRAARLADVAAMQALLDGGADISKKEKDGTSVLMLAAGAGWRTGETILGGSDFGPESDTLEAVRLCLERGATVNDVDANGISPLHDAVVRGPDVLRLLLDHGAQLDVKDKRGRTPLDVAQGVRGPGEAQRMKTSPLRAASADFLKKLGGAAAAADAHN
jgi:ankyrin repeat protein